MTVPADPREALTDEAMAEIAGAMPWYDEAEPDYSAAREAILRILAARQDEPSPALPRGVLLREIDDCRNAGIRPAKADELRAWNYLLDHFEQFVKGWPFPTSANYPPLAANPPQTREENR